MPSQYFIHVLVVLHASIAADLFTLLASPGISLTLKRQTILLNRVLLLFSASHADNGRPLWPPNHLPHSSGDVKTATSNLVPSTVLQYIIRNQQTNYVVRTGMRMVASSPGLHVHLVRSTLQRSESLIISFINTYQRSSRKLEEIL